MRRMKTGLLAAGLVLVVGCSGNTGDASSSSSSSSTGGSTSRTGSSSAGNSSNAGNSSTAAGSSNAGSSSTAGNSSAMGNSSTVAGTSTAGSSSTAGGSSVAGNSSAGGASSGVVGSSGGGGSSGVPGSSTGGGSSGVPASSSGGGVTSGGSSSGGCGRPITAVRTEDQICNSDDVCQCGLNCVANQCTRPCTTPDTQDNCGTGRLCVATNTPGLNVCVRVTGRDGDCFTGVCDLALSCDVASVDEVGNVNAAACHLPCNPDGTCANGESCLASTPGFVEVDNAADGGIPCNADAGPNGGGVCNGTFTCTPLSGGRVVCARPVRACGTAQQPYGFTPAGDGGVLPAADNQVCNLGPELLFNDGGIALPGSLFCDEYLGLPTPPEVFCYNNIDTNAPGFGYCVAICQYFFNGDGTQDRVMDCPSGYTCATSNVVFYNPAQINTASPPTPCTDVADCAIFPGAECADLTSGRVCAFPYGMCRPNP